MPDKLTDEDLTQAEQEAVAGITRAIELATAIAAHPDQIFPLARLLILAQHLAEIEEMGRDLKRLRDPLTGPAPPSTETTRSPRS